MPYQRSRTRLSRSRLSLRLRAAIVLCLAALAGCDSGDGLNRQAISGTVNLDGQPLPGGAILFEPATDESGTEVGTTIRQGTFSIPKDKGAVPGVYRVRIYSSSATQAPPAPGQTARSPRPMVDRLPPRYNTKTELKADIIAGRANYHRFNLSSSDSFGAR
jgi:hypothetical protein